MIRQIQTNHPGIVGFCLSGKLKDEDYRAFVPAIDRVIAAAQGSVRLLVQFEDFHGWDLHGAWDDFKFGIEHYADTERIAVIGDQRWEQWMTLLWKPFSRAEIRYFDGDETDQAWAWIREGL